MIVFKRIECVVTSGEFVKTFSIWLCLTQSSWLIIGGTTTTFGILDVLFAKNWWNQHYRALSSRKMSTYNTINIECRSHATSRHSALTFRVSLFYLFKDIKWFCHFIDFVSLSFRSFVDVICCSCDSISVVSVFCSPFFATEDNQLQRVEQEIHSSRLSIRPDSFTIVRWQTQFSRLISFVLFLLLCC